MSLKGTLKKGRWYVIMTTLNVTVPSPKRNFPSQKVFLQLLSSPTPYSHDHGSRDFFHFTELKKEDVISRLKKTSKNMVMKTIPRVWRLSALLPTAGTTSPSVCSLPRELGTLKGATSIFEKIKIKTDKYPPEWSSFPDFRKHKKKKKRVWLWPYRVWRHSALLPTAGKTSPSLCSIPRE